MDFNALALDLHEKHGGKITTVLRDPGPIDRVALSTYYTPGVAEVSRAIVADPATYGRYTWTNNLVAVISDGSAVLGLGSIGARGAMPVMEGKSLLFRHFAGIDSVPIVLDCHSVDEIVETVAAIAPSFGAINLEDIAAPQCFEIEERLKSRLDIPVMHDDQHGTAVVVLAGLINACSVTGRDLAKCQIVVSGVGAAGVAVMRLIAQYAPGVTIRAADSRGLLSQDRSDLNPVKLKLLDDAVISGDRSGPIENALVGADIFIGLSKPGALTGPMVATMAPQAIIFALANPDPEIMPNEAIAAGAAVVATGRSDLPNQVNNALAFPGIFRGALDHGVKAITDQHKLAAAQALASAVVHPSPDEVIPSVFTPGIADRIAATII